MKNARRFNAIATAATLAVVLGGASLLAGTIANVSATPGSLSIVQGEGGQFSVSIDKLLGSVPPRANKPPTVSYCQEWTIHVDGTATCEATGSFTLDKGRNYSQTPITVGEYSGAVTVSVDAGVPCNTIVNLIETFTVQAGSGLEFGDGVLEVSRNVAVTITCATSGDASGGCSQGYWKNHPAEWPAPYTANTTLRTVFQMGTFDAALGSTWLIDAIDAKEIRGGGSTAQGKAQNLLRNAVAALLNSAKSEITYAWTTAQVVGMVNEALASNDGDTMLDLNEKLDAANHGSPYCGDSAQ